jgi:selenocysteine lyase/cysteine desulfurase
MALRQEYFRKLDPLMVGAMTYGTPDDPTRIEAEMKEDANRFEPGSKGFLEILALASATRLLERTGMEKIAATIEDAARYLREGLSEMGYEIHSPHGDMHRGGIVNFGAGDRSPLRSTDAIAERLSSKRVSYAIRLPGVRLSPAAYNTREEINLVLRHLSVPQLAD